MNSLEEIQEQTRGMQKSIAQVLVDQRRKDDRPDAPVSDADRVDVANGRLRLVKPNR